MSNYRTFTTARLILKPTTEADAPLIRELFNSPKCIAYIGDRQLHTDEDAAAFIRNRALPQLHELGFSNNTIFLHDQTPIGVCGLYRREGIEGLDIGYAILPEFEKMGYATEAASCMMEFAREMEVSRVRAIIHPQNRESANLVLKLGFTFSENTTLPDETEPVDIYLFYPDTP